MRTSQRFKFPKTVMFAITMLYVILILATYFLYFQAPVIDCAKRLLLAQFIALGFQIVLNYFNYYSKEKIVILATLFVSAMIVSGVISSFFNFGLMCQYFGF